MDICEKLRPQTLDEIVGHKSVVTALRRILSDKTLLPHSFLFSGPSGVGKTTFARILAREVGCKPYSITEQDAVTQSSVDAMRELIANLRYPAMGGNPYRALILDEAHALTTATYQALLKDIEEPPAHLFYIFCTTNVNALPNVLMTRVHHFPLKPISIEDTLQYLYKVKISENFKISDAALITIAQKSRGSIRQALSFLSPLRDSTEIDTNDILGPEVELPSENFVALYRLICDKTQNWESEIFELLRTMSSENPENVRKGLIWYSSKTLFYGNPTNHELHKKILKCFSIPCKPENGMSDFIYKIYEFLNI